MSPRALWLHVGMDKTGTSSIQEFLHRNRAELASKHGIYYPQKGQWKDYSHHALAFQIFDPDTDTPAKTAALINEMVEATPPHCSRTIISSELLFKIPHRQNYWSQLKGLIDRFDELKIIVYVRRQDQWIQSRHKHSIVSGAEITLLQLQEKVYCDYLRWIDDWAKIAGAGNVIVRPFEKTRLHKGDLAADFLQLLSIDTDLGKFTPLTVANESLGNLEIEMKRVCNVLQLPSAASDEVNRMLITHTAQNKSPRNKANLMTFEERKALLERYDPTNAAIASKYINGGNASPPLFAPPEPDKILPWNRNTDCTTEDVAQLVRYMKSSRLVKTALESAVTPDLPMPADIVLGKFFDAISGPENTGLSQDPQRKQSPAHVWPWRNK